MAGMGKEKMPTKPVSRDGGQKGKGKKKGRIPSRAATAS